ncbi:acyltransferase family protein [Arthrobacter sp. MDT2-16]
MKRRPTDSTLPWPSSRAHISDTSFLDGIRGAAVLSVVVFHLAIYTGTSSDRDQYGALVALTKYGYLGVAVFIVVSGFVLMYPMARSHTLDLPRGTLEFYKRRARRILPPYYAALILSIGLIWAVPALQSPSNTAWDTKIPVTPSGISSHLLLLHDLSPAWVSQINGPLWSVAVELHLYLIMPLVLLPLWRRINSFVIVGLLGLLSLSFTVIDFATWAHPWLILLFAAGMLASQIATGAVKAPLLKPSVILTAGVVTMALALFHEKFTSEIALSEILFGMLTAGAIAWGCRDALNGQANRFTAMLKTKCLMYLGSRSYSIYLTHSPIFATGNLLLLNTSINPGIHVLLMFLVVLPAALLFGEVFYRLIERRFMTTHQISVRTTA